ncbi:MAG TPA: c-type cytochrome [Vicinamibacteria bacterium]|nr:c-type cytochrome [Vicinamibacteria bacterium]
MAIPAVFAAAAETRKWTAPDADKARVNPVEATPAALLKGRALYQKHCASCHGDKGKGDGPAESYEIEPATDLTDPALQERLTDGEMLWKMTTGLKSGTDVIMPGIVQRVPAEEDRWKLVRFVRTLQNKNP